MGTDVLESAYKGFNVSVFAYGQTGSGKSFSIVGDIKNGKNTGILPRVCDDIFIKQEQYRNDANSNCDLLIKVGLMEIYNENVYDLSFTKDKRGNKGLEIKEKVHQIVVEGLREVSVTSYKELDDFVN